MGYAIGKRKIILMVPMLLFCFLTMYYADITVTGQYGLVFLDSLFDKKLLSFYSNALASGIAPEGAVYDIGTYIIFGIWSIPIWILNKFTGVSVLSVGGLLWLKGLLILFLVGSIKVILLIASDLGFSLKRANEISQIFLLSSTVFFPVFVVAQYDVIPLFFMLLGIHSYMQNNRKYFLLFFAISMTIKPLTILILFLLILLKEKNLIKIGWSLIEGSSLMLLCKMLYSTNEAYRKSCSGFLGKNLPNLLKVSLDGGYGKISVFFMILILIYISAYMNNESGDSLKMKRITVIRIFAVWAAFCVFGTMAPYWTIYMAPFAVFTVFMNEKNLNRMLFIDFVGNVALSILLIMDYSWVYGGDKTYAYLLLKHFCGKVLNGGQGTTVAGILRHLSIQGIMPVIEAILTAWLLYIIYITYKTVNGDYLVDGKVEEHINKWNFMGRLGMGYFWIIITVGALALTVMGY